MSNKLIIWSLILVIIFGAIISYSLVFAWNNIKIIFLLSDKIYTNSSKLKKTMIVFKSNYDISNYKIKSNCDVFSNLKYKKWNKYLFELKIFENKCNWKNFKLISDNGKEKINFNLKLINEYDLYSNFIDIKSNYLLDINKKINKKIEKNSKFIKYNEKIEKNYFSFLKKNRKLNEFIYNKNLIENILEKRWEKYLVPILWYSLPTLYHKIPNSKRPYRNRYTDWIHHWWDIDSKFWEKIIALDDWIIVNVISNFGFNDLNKVKNKNLTYNDKIYNLDILRWNQIWLKTMKWDVVLYSHLNDIFSNIKVWEIVRKWQPIWTVWATWVPDKNYKDFHLHFTIHKNPYISKKIWKYSLDNYLKWDWLFKWKNKKYILKNQNNIFK